MTLATLLVASLLAAGGAPAKVQPRAQLSFKATGSTSWRNMDERLADVVNVKDFGAKGDGRTDATAAVVAAVAALPAAGTLLFPPGEYVLTDAITIPVARAHVLGYGAKLTQTTAAKHGLVLTAANITVEGVWLYQTTGATDWQAGRRVVGIEAFKVAGTRVKNVRLENWARAGFSINEAPDSEIRNSRIIGIGADPDGVPPYTALVPVQTDYAASNSCFGVEMYGYGTYDGTTGSGFPGTRIVGNVVELVAQGVFGYPDWNQIQVTGNRFLPIGQNCTYIDSPSNLTWSDNVCVGAPASALKAQIIGNPGSGVPGATLHDTDNLMVANNVIDGTGGPAIYVTPAVDGLTPRFGAVTVTGNTIRNPGLEGVRVEKANRFSITGNIIDGATQYGIRLGTPSEGTSRDGVISGNVVANSQLAALYVQADPAYGVTIEHNLLVEPSLAGGANYPVFLAAGEWVFRWNTIRAAVVGWSYNVIAGATAAITLHDNVGPTVRTDTGAGVTWRVDGTRRLPWRIDVPWVPSMNINASAGREFVITATDGVSSQINNPTAPTSDQRITIRVRNATAGAMGVLNWGTLYKMATVTKPAAGFSRAWDFQYDGTNWVEVSRTPADVPN